MLSRHSVPSGFTSQNEVTKERVMWGGEGRSSSYSLLSSYLLARGASFPGSHLTTLHFFPFRGHSVPSGHSFPLHSRRREPRKDDEVTGG